MLPSAKSLWIMGKSGGVATLHKHCVCFVTKLKIIYS